MTASHRLAAALAALALASAAQAQPHGAARAPAPTSLQGDAQSWIGDPHMHAFYEATVAAFAGGPARVDVEGYEAKSFAIFRDFGVSRGVGADAMQEHLKLIPRQVVQIVREDRAVLDSYANFVAAVFGPD